MIRSAGPWFRCQPSHKPTPDGSHLEKVRSGPFYTLGLTALSLPLSPPLGATGKRLVGNRAGEMTAQQDRDDSQLAGVVQERRTGRAPSRQVFQKGVPLLSQRSVGGARNHSRVMN